MPSHRSSPLALLFLAALACCSSSGSNGGAGDGGSSGDDGSTGNPLAARAYVHSRLTAGAGPNASAICGITDPAWIDIGTNIMSTTDGDVDPVAGQTVHVSCSVTANKDGTFQVSANGTLGSQGSVTIVGTFASGQTDIVAGVRGVFERGDQGHFEDDNCTVTYASLGPNFTPEPNVFAGVAPGRVWGVLDCHQAADSAQSRIGADGGATPRSCAALAELKFENCSQ